MKTGLLRGVVRLSGKCGSGIQNIARNTEKATEKRKKDEKKAFRACVFSKL